MTRPASDRRSSGSSVRISRQLAVPMIGRDVGQRRQRAENGGAAHNHVELAKTLIERGPERVDGFPVGEIKGNEARRPSGGADIVVGAPEQGQPAAEQEHVRPFAGEGESDGAAKPARGSGNKRNAVLEALDQPTSARKESCFCCGGPSRSRSRVGYSPVKQWSVNCGWAESRPS